MSSSTFEVTETENESEKEISFGLEACEENGIGLSAQVDGEVQKDHTYTKDPDGSGDEEEKVEDSQQEENDAPPEKRTTRNVKNSKTTKKANAKNSKAKKDASPKKETPASKKGKAKKEVLTEESNKSDDNNPKPEKSEEKNDVEEQTRSSKRGKKRKVEEKENVIDRSIVEEVQNINEGDTVAETTSESPAKKKNVVNTVPEKAKAKKTPKSAPTVEDGEDNQNLPKGWVRKVVVRKSGKTAGQIDIYIYSPDGTKFRSRPDIAAYLARTKSNLKLEDFSFSKKAVSEDSIVKTTTKKEKPAPTPKPKNTPEKKKDVSPAPKRGSKLVVKLNFSPKSRKGKNVKKTSDKQTRQIKSSAKKGKASSSSSKSSKKKTA